MSEEKVETHWAYCSACDRQVKIAVWPGARVDPDTGHATDEVICLEVGHTCTGALCPITNVPPDEMRARLESLRPTDAER